MNKDSLHKILVFVFVCVVLSTFSVCKSECVYLVPKTEENIVLDGLLAEYNCSLVITTTSPVESSECLMFYFSYNEDYLFVAGCIYDPDNLPDDTVRIYINTASGVESWNISEGSSSSWYVATKSHVSSPYWRFECAIDNSTIGLHMFKLMIEYESTHIKVCRMYLPSQADISDPSTWLSFEYYVPPPTSVLVKINLRDRNNNTLKPIGNVTLVRLYNDTWDSGYILALDSTVEYNLSKGVYNVSIVVYGNKVYRFAVNTTESSIFNISIPNVVMCNTTDGYIVVTVGENSTIEGIVCKTDTGYLSIIVDAFNDSSVWIDSITPWKYVCVLFSSNFTYNPLTNHLLSVLPKGKNSIILLTGENEPVIYSSNSSIHRYVYDPYTQLVSILLNASTELKMYHTTKPVAVVLNGRALKYGVDWSFDELLNITSICAGGGVLNIYYAVPVRFTVSSSQKLTVFISTPYTFRGRILIPEGNIDERVDIEQGGNVFTFDLPSGTYTVKIYDVDSDMLIGSTKVSIAEVPPEEVTVEIVPCWIYILVVVLVVIVLVLAVWKGFEKTVYRHKKYWAKT